jgi:tetratricopeptide (TPR) repeat protein
MTAAALTFFVVRTVRYESVWGVPQKLWAYAHQRSHDVRATSNLAQAMYVNHRYDEAEQLYQTIVWTNTVEAWTGIACVYFNTGRYSDAKDAMDRAVLAMGRRRPSQQADVLYLRGQIEWPFDREAAIRDWEEAVRIDPKHERARAGLSAPDAPPSGL